jgi:transposase InsO family protein
VPDLLRRDFSAGTINEKWCGDLTEIPTDEGNLYLASALDMASRRIAGFALGEHHGAELARGSLTMAAAIRGGDVKGVIFHPERARSSPQHFLLEPVEPLVPHARWGVWDRASTMPSSRAGTPPLSSSA